MKKTEEKNEEMKENEAEDERERRGKGRNKLWMRGMNDGYDGQTE